MRFHAGVSCLACAAICACGGNGNGTSAPPIPPTHGPPPLAQRISSDPFQGFGGQFATEVEPSIASDGFSTIVAAFQVGRDLVAGGDAIGFAASFDRGLTWTAGSLPGITRANGGAANSATDAVVAFDAAHHVWLVSSLPIVAGNVVPGPVVSRSPDGARWFPPVAVKTGDVSDDKEWIACDNNPGSAFRGRCYLEWDDAGNNGLVRMSYSPDGGATWSAPVTNANGANGIGGQILILPSGAVVVVTDDFNEANLFSFVSHDGGVTWGASVPLAPVIDHLQAASLRSGPLVAAAVDASGIVYAVWQDCRFRTNCTQDDLILSTSPDGATWSVPSRIPIDELASTVDHFIPGVSIEPATGGANAHLAVTYYEYPIGACTTQCVLDAAYVASFDGGKTWGTPTKLSPEMFVSSMANTTQGRMVADYATITYIAQTPIAAFEIANVPSGSIFDEATYATLPGAISLGSAARRSSVGERPVRGAHSDHPLRHIGPPDR